MSNEESKEWALFGGSGFIGQHLAHSVLDNTSNVNVTLLDIRSPAEQGWKVPLQPFLDSRRLNYVTADVRDMSQLEKTAQAYDVIVNLAAIHREPGHEPEEYFATNVSGAENICRLAETIGCKEIIFTSSISVYGIHDRPADESSIPEPKMPYGQSKLEAEGIHRAWAERTSGKLSIVRPGVVFGPGEEGNVTRLVGEMLKRDRAIQIQPDQVKASIYIEELVAIIHWLRFRETGDSGYHLVNGVSEIPITLDAYGQALQRLKKFSHKPFVVPAVLLKLAAGVLTPVSRFFPTGSKFHPRRITKLTLVNDIRATELKKMGYHFRWSLDDALQHWLERGL